MKVYMAVTADRLELPLCVSDNCDEIALFIGRPRSHVHTLLSRGTVTKRGLKLLRVDIDDDTPTERCNGQ